MYILLYAYYHIIFIYNIKGDDDADDGNLGWDDDLDLNLDSIDI